jgi:acetyl esterase/lipase
MLAIRAGSAAPRYRLEARPWAVMGILVLGPALQAATPDVLPAQAAEVHRGIVYASVNGRDLALDLHLPAGRTDPPLVVWVHGGAWRSGSREQVPPIFVENGFATASLDFRQSTEARFPAQVHDIKAAIRFLRARAATYGYRTDRIAIAGSSSGGHLAALVGVSGGDPTLEGTLGDHGVRSSDVQAILVYYGASNLMSILRQSTEFGLGVRVPALQSLLGGQPHEVPALAELASPVFHVDADDPPLLIFHGDRDPQMPIAQAYELMDAFREAGPVADLVVVRGAEHGGDVFWSGVNLERALRFLRGSIGW